MRSFDSRLALRVAATAGAALSGGLISAIVVGGIVASATITNPNDLAELGAAMAAAAAGLLAGVVVFVAVTVAGVRRAVPEGRRAATATGLILAPIVVAAAAGVVDAGRPYGLIAALALLVAAAVVVLALAGALRARRAVLLGGPAGVVAVVCVALSVVLRTAAPVPDLAGLYRRGAVPVALVDGTTLDAPAPGWRVTSVEHPLDLTTVPGPLALPAAVRASVSWRVRSGVVKLQFMPPPAAARLTECPKDVTVLACERLGVTPAGAVIWGTRLPADPTPPGYQGIWVTVDGGRWHLSGAGPFQELDVAEAVQVLSRLQAVEIDRYLAVAGAPSAGEIPR